MVRRTWRRRIVRSKNIAFQHDEFGIVQARRAKAGAVVEIIPTGTDPPDGNDTLDPTTLAVVEIDIDGRQTFQGSGGVVTPAATDVIQLVEMQVIVTSGPNG